MIERIGLKVSIAMETYIANPYWPETDDMIEVQKKSNMNRAQSDAKRDAALKGYLERIGMTMDEYQALVAKSQRQWYRRDNDDDKSEIVIPRHQISGALVQTVKTAPSSIRGKYREETLRAKVRIGDFGTGKTKADGVFDRYVMREGSNQRGRQKNEYIKDFRASGHLEVELPFSVKDLESMRIMLNYAFREVGIGASRKMGYGRGLVEDVSASDGLSEAEEQKEDDADANPRD